MAWREDQDKCLTDLGWEAAPWCGFRRCPSRQQQQELQLQLQPCRWIMLYGIFIFIESSVPVKRNSLIQTNPSCTLFPRDDWMDDSFGTGRGWMDRGLVYRQR
mmetsp:Transcript_6077/g.15077  ORF Transcript_6077/g.15077 Transcript_6077/m.15077 type:complete len:103 (+) Transcript_6077:404-712(+)